MRRQQVILLALLLLAFGIRLAYWERSASFGRYELSYDDDEYYQAARLLADGEWLRDPYPWRYTRSPGYPLFLAAVFAAFGSNIALALAFQVGLSVLGVALVYLLARRAFDRRVGLIAAGLMAVAPLYASLAGSFVLTETLFATCTLLLIYLFWRGSEQGMSVWRAGWVGVLWGYTTLVRGQVLFFWPLAALWLVIRARRQARPPICTLVISLASTIGGLVLVIAPWAYRNYLAYDRFVWLDTSSGWTIWRDHRVPGDDFWETLPQIANPADRAAYATARGIQNILADPYRQLVVNGVANLAALLRLQLDSFARGGGYLSDVIVDAPELWLVALDDLFFLLVWVLALAGMLLNVRRLPGLLVLWLVFIGALTFFLHTQSRFRAHYLFVLIIFAAAALARFAESRARNSIHSISRATWITWVGLSLLVLALAYSPRLVPLLVSEYHLAQSQGRDIAAAQAAVAAFPEYAAAYDALGDAYRHRGEWDKALEAYQRALELNAYELQARLGRIDIFRQRGETRKLERELQAAGLESGEMDVPAPLWWSFDPAPTRVVELGDSVSSVGYILNFHAIQADGAEKMRFTKERSFVKFPGVNAWRPQTLVLYARAVPVPGRELPQVSVWFNGQPVARVPLTTAWQDHVIPLEERFRNVETLVVEFRSPTFQPSRVFENAIDTRELGFMVGYVELR